MSRLKDLGWYPHVLPSNQYHFPSLPLITTQCSFPPFGWFGPQFGSFTGFPFVHVQLPWFAWKWIKFRHKRGRYENQPVGVCIIVSNHSRKVEHFVALSVTPSLSDRHKLQLVKYEREHEVSLFLSLLLFLYHRLESSPLNYYLCQMFTFTYSYWWRHFPMRKLGKS